MYKWILAWRYFRKRPITLLAVAAVALCVFIVVVVMTVMNGLVEEFRQKNHRYVGDCVVSSESLVGFGYYEKFQEILETQPFVAAVSPVVRQVGLLTQPQASWNIGVDIVGIDPRLHAGATGFGETLHYRKNAPELAFVPTYEADGLGCVIGIDLMPNRRLPEGGYYHAPEPFPMSIVVSSFPLNIRGGLARAGTDSVSSRTFYYSDDSHTGIVKVDGNTVYLPLDTAQTLCGMTAPCAASTKCPSLLHPAHRWMKGCRKSKHFGIPIRRHIATCRAVIYSTMSAWKAGSKTAAASSPRWKKSRRCCCCCF